jgi:hypothetical protein
MHRSFEERAAERRLSMTAHVAHSKAEALRLERLRDVQLLPDERAEAIWVITTIDGVSFEGAWEGRVASTYAGVPVNYIGKAQVLANEAAATRPQDLVDVAM